MSKLKQCFDKIRSAGKVDCVIGGKRRDYAFIAKEVGAFLLYDKRAETLISAFDSSTYEACTPCRLRSAVSGKVADVAAIVQDGVQASRQAYD